MNSLQTQKSRYKVAVQEARICIIQFEQQKTKTQNKTQMNRTSTTGKITKLRMCYQKTKGWEKELPKKYIQIQEA